MPAHILSFEIALAHAICPTKNIGHQNANVHKKQKKHLVEIDARAFKLLRPSACKKSIKVRHCFCGVQKVWEPNNAAASSAFLNPDAIPMFFHLLQHSPQDVMLWGLQTWQSLLQGSLGNLSACTR